MSVRAATLVAVELLYTGIIGFARTMFKVQGLDLTIRGERNFPEVGGAVVCLLYTSPSPRDRTRSRMPSSA